MQIFFGRAEDHHGRGFVLEGFDRKHLRAAFRAEPMFQQHRRFAHTRFVEQPGKFELANAGDRSDGGRCDGLAFHLNPCGVDGRIGLRRQPDLAALDRAEGFGQRLHHRSDAGVFRIFDSQFGFEQHRNRPDGNGVRIALGLACFGVVAEGFGNRVLFVKVVVPDLRKRLRGEIFALDLHHQFHHRLGSFVADLDFQCLAFEHFHRSWFDVETGGTGIAEMGERRDSANEKSGRLARPDREQHTEYDGQRRGRATPVAGRTDGENLHAGIHLRGILFRSDAQFLEQPGGDPLSVTLQFQRRADALLHFRVTVLHPARQLHAGDLAEQRREAFFEGERHRDQPDGKHAPTRHRMQRGKQIIRRHHQQHA